VRNVLLLVVFLMAPVVAHAELLGTTTFTASVGQNRIAAHTVWLRVCYFDLATVEHSEGLFDHLEIDASAIGTTLSATMATDPDFGQMTGRLTNGIGEYMAMRTMNSIGEISAPWRQEAAWFGLAQADFAGYQIEEITFYIDDLTFQEPTPNGGTKASLTGSVSVYGTAVVPIEAVSWGVMKALYRSVPSWF
jgi:hypothetical protein